VIIASKQLRNITFGSFFYMLFNSFIMLALSSKKGSRVETTSIYHVDRMRTASREVSHGEHCVGLGDNDQAAFVCDKCK